MADAYTSPTFAPCALGLSGGMLVPLSWASLLVQSPALSGWLWLVRVPMWAPLPVFLSAMRAALPFQMVCRDLMACMCSLVIRLLMAVGRTPRLWRCSLVWSAAQSNTCLHPCPALPCQLNSLDSLACKT